MNYNTQNAKIASITEKTLVVGIDVGSEIHYARAFEYIWNGIPWRLGVPFLRVRSSSSGNASHTSVYARLYAVKRTCVRCNYTV